jgi:hypothetical protein
LTLTPTRRRSGTRLAISSAPPSPGWKRDRAFSIILGRLQHELRDAYGAENARKVLQAIMQTMAPAQSIYVPQMNQYIWADAPSLQVRAM